MERAVLDNVRPSNKMSSAIVLCHKGALTKQAVSYVLDHAKHSYKREVSESGLNFCMHAKHCAMDGS